MSTPGSTRASSCSASARGATGHSTEAASWPLPTYPATSTSTRHHPCERHSHGSTIRTACTRPGGTVWSRVSSRPRRTRSPSGDSATVKPKCGPTRLIVTGTAARAIGTARPSTDHSRAMPATTRTPSRTTTPPMSGDRPQGRLDQPAQRHLEQHRLGRLGRVVVQARGPGEQLGPQLLRGRLGQVGQRRLRRRPAGDLEPHLGQPERAGDQRAHHVDRLQPVQPDPPGPLGTARRSPAAGRRHRSGSGWSTRTGRRTPRRSGCSPRWRSAAS